jgi:hypothetical protein
MLDGICRRGLIELNLATQFIEYVVSRKFVVVAGCHAMANSDREKCDVETQIDKPTREHNEGACQTERPKE